jgi:hypothetical protein
MEPCPRCSGFGSLIGRLGRLVWLVCRACRTEFTIDEADCQEEVH